MEEHPADILKPHKRVITLIPTEVGALAGDIAFYLKFVPK